MALAVLLSPLPGQIRTTRPEEAGFSAERLRRVGETMQQHIDAGNISGAVTLVASRGRVVHFEAYGLVDLESKRDLLTHTSGIGPSAARAEDTLGSLVPRYATVPLLFQPGTESEYIAFAGPDVLARIC
jgi:CubicO group peptidase (beta-lactamase class C family)